MPEVVYISGLIASPLPDWAVQSGYDHDWFKGLFAKFSGALASVGHYPLNPFEVDACSRGMCNGDQDTGTTLVGYEHSWECYMRHDIEAIVTDPRCRTIMMLPGWASSRGAKVERALCESLGFSVYLGEYDAINDAVRWAYRTPGPGEPKNYGRTLG